VDLSHAAATPPGMTVTVKAELVAVEGRKLRFHVSAHDGADLVSEGTHERFVVDAERFVPRVAAKADAAGVAAPSPSAAAGPRFDPRPVRLEGMGVRLEPLELRHAEDLLEAGRDASVWRFRPGEPFETLDDVRRWIDAANAAVREGREVAFAIVRLPEGAAVGSTRCLDLRRADRALEIGSTWLGPAAQRSGVNTECKLLLLRHAFEDLGAVRVQLKTDGRNARSQQAIARLGAVREGVLRRHMTLADGFVRDTVMFSITDAEWPAVKERLEARLRRGGDAG
jgi:RimJ/RimL family protein N-acetyltransferase